MIITRTFDGPPARVFRALTTPEDLNVWAWAGLSGNPSAEIDLRVGGRFCIGVDNPDPNLWPRPRFCMRGLYVEIVPDRRLVHTLHWDAPVFYNQTDEACPDELIIIDLEPHGENGTNLTYVHHGIPNAEAEAEHRRGVMASHDLLEGVVGS